MKSIGLFLFCFLTTNSYSQNKISAPNLQALSMYAETLDEDDPCLYYLDRVSSDDVQINDVQLEKRSDYSFVLDSIWDVDTLVDAVGQWPGFGKKFIFEYEGNIEFETAWERNDEEWKKLSKIERRYDDNNNLLEYFELAYLEEDPLEFVPYLNLSYQYNMDNYLISTKIISYQYTDSIRIIYNRRTDFEYNANNQIISEKNYDLLDPDVDELLAVKTYNYNSFNLPASILIYFKDAESNSLYLLKKDTFKFINDTLVAEIESILYNKIGVIDDLTVDNYLYDSLSRVRAIVRSRYFDSDQVIFGDSTNYFYNLNGNVVESNNWDWDQYENEYFVDFEVHNGYDSLRNLTHKNTFSEFDENRGEFSRKEFEKYDFDNFSNVIDFQISTNFTNSLGEIKIDNDWIRFDFNNEVLIEETKLPLHFRYPFKSNNLLNHVLYSPEGSGLGLPTSFRTINYYYTELGTSSDGNLIGKDALTVNITPNPIVDEFAIQLESHIELVDLVIVSLNGSEVYRGSVNNNQSVSIADIPSGMYIYKVSSGNRFHTGKIIKI